MPISDRLTQKIFEVFGSEAGNDLLTWMRTIEGQYVESRAPGSATAAASRDREPRRGSAART